MLLPVLTANAGSLRELRLHNFCPRHYNLGNTSTIDALITAAPLLQVLSADNAECTWHDAPRLLRAEPPFAPLQLRRRLQVRFDDVHHFGGMERVGPFAVALADATLQPALLRVEIYCADLSQPALMGALVDAALARRLRQLTLDWSTPPAAAPLARLLAEGSLNALEIELPQDFGAPLFDAAGAALMAGALRVNTTLTKLGLGFAGLCLDMRVAGTLLGALVGHPSLRALWILWEKTPEDNCSAFGASLAALIAASDAPALQDLNFSNCYLRDAGLAPIVEALALNRHLRTLDLCWNRMSEAFACGKLMPAVRENMTLRELRCLDDDSGPAAWDATELVRRRWQHD